MQGEKIGFLKVVVLSLIIMMLLQAITVYAKDDFELKVLPIKDKIGVEEDAIFNLTLVNNKDTADEFRIYTLAYPLWDIKIVPLQNPIHVEVPAKSSRTIQVFLDPLKVTLVGNYQIDVFMQSLSNEKSISAPLELRIKSNDPLIEGYVPTVSVNLEMPLKIDPREKVRMRIGLANQNNLDYPEIRVLVNSKFINEEIKTSLAPQEDKTIELLKEIPPKTAPQPDKIVVALLRGNRSIETKSQTVEIIGYSNIVREDKTVKSFLKTVNKIKFTNIGNIPSLEPLKANTTAFKSLFTITKPKTYSAKEGDSRVFVWEHDIAPYESFEVSTVESYRALFLVIILGIAMVVVYFMYRSPMIFRKAVTNITKAHGGISQMQISLSIKNRGNSTMNNIEVVDIIPALVNLETGLLIGTLHPSKIEKKEKIGTTVKWDIKSLDAGEERVITYKVTSRLPILGGITLPIANSKFLYQTKVNSAKSNVHEVKV